MSATSKNDRVFNALRHSEAFIDLDLGQIDAIAHAVREHRYEPGQIIFQQSDVCDRLLVVLAGTVSVSFSSEDGKEVIVCELKAGDVVGEMELLSNSRRLTNGIASSRTRLLAMDKRTFERLLGYPAFTKALLTIICRRLQQSLVFAEGLSIHPVETRLARLLVSMSETHGRRVGDGVMIDRSISQSLIGQMVNASRPRVNIQLQSWKNEKLIRVSDNRITILDERAMRCISRSPLAAGQ